MSKRRARRADASPALPVHGRGGREAGTSGTAEHRGDPQCAGEGAAEAEEGETSTAVEPELLEAGELDDSDLSDSGLSDTGLPEGELDALELDAGEAADAAPGEWRRRAPEARAAGSSLVPHSGVVPQDALARYFQEISRYPLLDRDAEHELAVRVQESGDRDAAQTLVLSNLRLVVRIAMEYRRVWTNLLDLIQEGNVGLLQAVSRFDPYRGVKLSSYGAYWIRAYILKYLIDNIRTVRLGSSRAERKVFYSLSRARRELERQGFSPTPALLAERLDVEPADIESMERRLSQADVSLDAPLSAADPGGATLGDRQSSPGQRVDEAVSAREMQSAFRQHVERFAQGLGERESIILRERMLAEEPSTLQDIGERFGLTRERVRQIEKKLVERLRGYLKENLVDFDYWAPED